VETRYSRHRSRKNSFLPQFSGKNTTTDNAAERTILTREGKVIHSPLENKEK
jgi:hypothetical protein